MSKKFLIEPNSTSEIDANDYEKVTKFDKKFIHFSKDGKPHKFGYCTSCGLKVFLTKPKIKGGDYFFRHESGYYSETEQIRMLSCRNYHPSTGIRGNPKKLNQKFLAEIITFLKDNAFWIFKYINSKYMLYGKAFINYKYFVSQIENIFIKNVKSLSTSDLINERMLPYNILALINDGTGNINYTDASNNSINFMKLHNEDKIPFFNYYHFSLEKDFFKKGVLGLETVKNLDFKGNDITPPKVMKTIYIPIKFKGLYEFIEHEKKFEKKYQMSSEELKERNYQYIDTILKEQERYHYIKQAMHSLFLE